MQADNIQAVVYKLNKLNLYQEIGSHLRLNWHAGAVPYGQFLSNSLIDYKKP